MSVTGQKTLDEMRAEAIERLRREDAAQDLVIDRAGVSRDAPAVTFRTSAALAAVNLDDLCVPPGFDTPEWRSRQTAKTLVGDSDQLARIVGRYRIVKAAA